MEEGFKKIDVAPKINNDLKTGGISSMPKKRKFSFPKFSSKKSKIIGAIVVILLLLFVYVGIFSFIFVLDLQKTYAQVKVAYASVKKQDIGIAKEEFVKTQKQIAVLKKDLVPISFLGYIPVVGWYYNDVAHGVSAAEHGLNAAVIATDSLLPYADVLGLKGESSFTQGSAEDRIRIAIRTLGKVVPQIDTIEKEIIAAQEDVDKINPNHYPPIWKLKTVHDQLVQLKDVVNGASLAVQDGKPLIKLLPELMGEKEDKKYLVIFQNDKELRPTGGFMTFYSVFRVEEGVIKVDNALDIYSLDDSLPKHEKAPPIIAKYLPKVDTFNIRDSNLSPDYVESMKTFYDMYQTSSQASDIDGIIAIDTHFLVSVLEILGEVEAGGLKFNAENDERCNCPQVVYQLENEITRPVNYVKSNRKGLLADLLYATMQKTLSSSPGQYWGRVIQAAIQDAQEKHIMFYLLNPEAQKGIEALDWGGRIKDFEGDYLHINDANFGGAKSNLFVEQAVKVDFNISKDGTVKKTVTISYKNPEEHSDCGLESGGLCLNATLRNFQRVYVPEGSKLTSSKGSEVKTEEKEELGKTFFESFLTVNPKGTAQITYEYALPFKVESKTLPFLIQKQPGTDAIPYEIYVNGKKFKTFDLTMDTQLQIPVK